jgi:hypothetical protein
MSDFPSQQNLVRVDHAGVVVPAREWPAFAAANVDRTKEPASEESEPGETAWARVFDRRSGL